MLRSILPLALAVGLAGSASALDLANTLCISATPHSLTKVTAQPCATPIRRQTLVVYEQLPCGTLQQVASRTICPTNGASLSLRSYSQRTLRVAVLKDTFRRGTVQATLCPRGNLAGVFTSPARRGQVEEVSVKAQVTCLRQTQTVRPNRFHQSRFFRSDRFDRGSRSHRARQFRDGRGLVIRF